MTDAPAPGAPLAEMVDCDGHVWTRLYPWPGYLAVPLTAEQLGAVAEHERQKGSFIAATYDFFRFEAESGQSYRVTPRIPVAAVRAADGTDSLGRQWLQAAPADGMAGVVLVAGEAQFLANAYRDEAERYREDGRLSEALVLAARGMALRRVAHGAEPGLSLAEGHPQFPGMQGTA